MDSDDDIKGDIYDPQGQIQIDWKIKNYFSLSQKADTAYESPDFHFSNASWCLKIFPNGQRSRDSIGWIDFSLEITNSESKRVPVNFTIGIKSYDGKIFHQTPLFSHTFTIDDELDDDVDTYECSFIQRTQLLSNRQVIAPDGTLTVFFKGSNALYFPTDATTQTEVALDTTALSRDLKRLLHSERKHDVVIKVQNQILHAHKAILGARSSVFAAMFELNLKENSTGVVNIEDCDLETFREFLSFVYTGNVEKLSSENVTQLFKLSDKYDVSELKQMCLDFMRNNLCLNTVCDAISIADKYNESDLKALAKQFIIDNIKSLLLSEKWFLLVEENKLLASELIKSAIPDTKR